MDERGRERERREVVSHLGMQAAEMRALSAQLADACARQDVETACDLAEALKVYHRDFAAIYQRLLSISLSTRAGAGCDLDMAERMST
jgi:hypothetical protein